VTSVPRAVCGISLATGRRVKDLFLFERERKLAYRGQFDASRLRNNQPLTGDDLDRAVEAVLAGQPVPDDQVPSVGCNIKWKPGNQPRVKARLTHRLASRVGNAGRLIHHMKKAKIFMDNR
jgi:hypothetical protein